MTHSQSACNPATITNNPPTRLARRKQLGLRVLPQKSTSARCFEIKPGKNSECDFETPSYFLTSRPSPTQHPRLFHYQQVRRKCSYLKKLAFKMARRPARCYRYCKNKVRWNFFANFERFSDMEAICGGVIRLLAKRERQRHHDDQQTLSP